MEHAKRIAQSAKRNFTKGHFVLISLVLSLALCPMPYALCEESIPSVSSTELIENAKQYDGREVVYEGEAVGEVMVRGHYAWVNLNNGQNALGIWVDKNLAKEIVYVGNYKTKGDWVRVSGVFNRSCREHGGDLDIHAKDFKALKKGERINPSLDLHKVRLMINLGIALFAVIILILILQIFKNRRSKIKH